MKTRPTLSTKRYQRSDDVQNCKLVLPVLLNSATVLDHAIGLTLRTSTNARARQADYKRRAAEQRRVTEAEKSPAALGSFARHVVTWLLDIIVAGRRHIDLPRSIPSPVGGSPYQDRSNYRRAGC